MIKYNSVKLLILQIKNIKKLATASIRSDFLLNFDPFHLDSYNVFHKTTFDDLKRLFHLALSC